MSVSPQNRRAPNPGEWKRSASGFTMLELLAAIAVISILAALLLPGLARAKATSRSIVCLNNLKQLQAGYLMYVHENDDALPVNRARSFGLGDVRSVDGSWVMGNTRKDTNSANIEAGTIFRHVGSASVYRCPSDRSVVSETTALRTRSYSVEGWLNTYYTAKGFEINPNLYLWTKYKLSEIRDPSPSGVFVFIDEHEQSIDAGVYILTQPRKVSSPEMPVSPELWYSLPADRHQQGCNLSFLDGHAEHWRWIAPKVFRQFMTPAGNDLADLHRLNQCIPHNETPKQP